MGRRGGREADTTDQGRPAAAATPEGPGQTEAACTGSGETETEVEIERRLVDPRSEDARIAGCRKQSETVDFAGEPQTARVRLPVPGDAHGGRGGRRRGSSGSDK